MEGVNYQIVVTQPARQDLQSALSYLTQELKNPQAARDLLDAVEKDVQSLSRMPERFPLVRDEALRREGIRFFPIKHYLLFYTVRRETNTVVIQRFLYGRRNWADLLRPEED